MADAFLDYLNELEKNGGEIKETAQRAEKEEQTFSQPKKPSTEKKTSQNKGVCKLKLQSKRPEPAKPENIASERKETPLIEITEEPTNVEVKSEVQEPPISPLEKKSSAEVEELLKRAETHFPDEWMAKYELAHRSKKTDYATQKIREGKFRLNKEKKLEILSEFDIYGKSSLEVLSQNYDTKG